MSNDTQTVPVKKHQVPPALNDRFIMRVLDAQFGTSSSQNPMITLECEILKPTSVKIGGILYDELDGIKPTPKFYLTLTDKNKQNVDEAMERLGLEPITDIENPNTEQFKGIVFAALLQSQERTQMKANPDDPKGKKVPVLDGRGQPVKLGWQMNYQLGNIIGRAEDEVTEELASRPAGL